jgi:hypothetical protein
VVLSLTSLVDLGDLRLQEIDEAGGELASAAGRP